MIIYNDKKEFIGIDEEGLRSLGFSNLADLQSETVDFADLFVKTPGFIHNFKHVHWIDFVLCEEDKNACKAIIHAKGKNFNCLIEIKTIYLTTSPNSKSYIINLNNLRSLSSNETSEISSELQVRDAPVTVVHKDEKVEDTTQIKPIKKSIIEDPYEIDDDLSLDDELSQEQLDAIGEPDVAIGIDLYKEDKKKKEEKTVVKEIPFDTNTIESELGFDIKRTAEILDMDIANIEDFVNDFVTQAKEFKDKLYNSVEQEDLIVLKTLSHQLKGVAANLRIHDCQNILVKINRSDDFTSAKADLDTFYKFIAKLSNEEEPSATNTEVIEPKIDEDDYILEIDDTLLTETNNNDTKINSLEEDDFIIEIDDAILTDTIDKDDNIPDINDFDNLDVGEDINLKTNKEEFSSQKTSLVKKYDKAKIANEIGLDEQSFNELFQDYIYESQDLISTIQTSIDNDDSTDWRHSAIKLKGMSDNMRINNFSTELETIISTDDKASAQNALKQLKISLSKIITIKD